MHALIKHLLQDIERTHISLCPSHPCHTSQRHSHGFEAKHDEIPLRTLLPDEEVVDGQAE